MAPETEIALLRIAQESLTNLAKHARAGKVQITLSYMEGQVALDIRDDGVGFSQPAQTGTAGQGHGFGLVGMRQRMQRLNGWLSIESEEGAGTAVSASVPVPRPENEES